MNARKTTDTQAAATAFAPFNAFADWNRQQVAAAVDTSYALFRGFEAMRQCWIDIAAATLEMQTQMMAGATHLVDSDAALQAASSIEAFDPAARLGGLFGPFGLRTPTPARR